MARLLRVKSLFPQKRKGNAVMDENVQCVKRVCIDHVSKCVSESEYEHESEDDVKQPSKQQQPISTITKKKKSTVTKEEHQRWVFDY